MNKGYYKQRSCHLDIKTALFGQFFLSSWNLNGFPKSIIGYIILLIILNLFSKKTKWNLSLRITKSKSRYWIQYLLIC